MLFSRRLLGCLAAVFLLVVSGISQAEIKSRIKPGWNKSDENSQVVLPHYSWTRFLQAYVKTDTHLEKNVIDYQAVTVEDKRQLKKYIKSLEAIDPRTLTQKEQFAYWVNLYNALTVQLVLDHYPIDSIKNIKSYWFQFGPWDKALVTIAGEPFSLNDIQHKILRPIWKTPLVHYALSCAAISCPQIRKKAYTAKNSLYMLRTSARLHINHADAVRFSEKRLHLSSMYQWYSDDFAQDNGRGVMGHIIRFADQPLRSQLRAYRGLIYFDFDWALNKPQDKGQSLGE